MKILQLNAWGGRLDKQILNLLKAERPNIICLQEAISLLGDKSGGFFVTVETIAEELKLHLSFSPTIGFKFMHRNAEFGNAILSTLPFESQHTIFTCKDYIRDFDAAQNDDHNARNLHHVTIKTNRGLLNILTHHGYHIPSHKNGDDETLRQCKLIADYIGTLDGEIILAGDFNLAPHSPSLEQINRVLCNACIKHEVMTTRTELTDKTEVCDYIFANSNVIEKSFRVSDELVSDHKALVMEFEQTQGSINITGNKNVTQTSVLG